jgi:hypothetical protein
MINFNQGLETVVQSLSLIEGDGWSKRQFDEEGFNVATIYKAWKLMQEQEPEYCQEYPNDIVDPSWFSLPGDSEIYGESGYTRYMARLNGEIVASLFHMPEKSPKIKIINELGIKWV